ncbi:MAG: transglycosylase domain-containing protein [Deferribacterales bacterium]
MRLLRFFGGLIVLAGILCYGVLNFYRGEMMFFEHFLPDDYSIPSLSRQGQSFTVYDSAGNLLEQRTFLRSEPFTDDETELFSEWFRVLDLELDGYPLPKERLELYFMDYMEIETEAVKSYIVNHYADRLLEGTPVTGLRLRLLRFLTADRLLKTAGFPAIYAAYADSIIIGDDTYGIKAASKTFFSRSIHMANQKEKAFLFTMLKDYTLYDPIENFAATERRANIYLHMLYQRGILEREEYLSARDYRLTLNMAEDPAPQEIEYLRAVAEEMKALGVEAGEPCEVHTYFDAEKTEMLRLTVSEYMKTQEEGLQAAFVLLDTEKGGIVAMTGAREGKSLKRAYYTKRQTGSTFKPIVYASAFDGGIRPTDFVNDRRHVYKLGKGSYSPRNFEELYMGSIPVRKGLVYSLNNATIQLAVKAGLKKVAEDAVKMGMKADVRPYLAMPLGVFPVTPVNLAQVYGTLADYGVYRKRGLIERIEFPDGRVITPGGEKTRVLDEKAAFQTLYIMQDVPRIGTAKGKGLMKGTAAKTGTTDEYRDAWLAAVFPPYVAVVWIGYDSGRSMGEKGTGGTKAAPLAAAAQRKLFEKGAEAVFPVPAGVGFRKVSSADGRLITARCASRRGYTEALSEDNLPEECVR